MSIRPIRALVAALGLAGTASAQQPDAPNPLPTAEQRLAAVAATATAPCVEAPPALPPFSGPLMERPYLLGDWLGVRDVSRDHGITWDISSTNFYQGVASGGLEQRFAFGGRGDILMHVDGEKAGLWKGLFVDLHGETLYGQNVNSSTGAMMPIALPLLVPSTNPPVTALTRVKITQALSENFVTFFGKLNLLDEFNQPFTGGARGQNGFMNAAMVFNPVFARTVPYSTFGAGFAVLKDFEPVFSVMVLDPNNTPTVSGFDTFFDRGASVIVVGNLPVKLFGLPGHQGIGASYSNSRYASLEQEPFFLVSQLIGGGRIPLQKETGSWAIEYAFDQALWVDPCDPKRSWGLFGNAGISDGNPNPIKWTANIGVGGSSPIRGRKLDTFGVGYYYLGISDYVKDIAPRFVQPRDEQGVELFYNVGVTPWFHVSPDLQIINPVRSRTDTSVNFGLRAKVDF